MYIKLIEKLKNLFSTLYGLNALQARGKLLGHGGIVPGSNPDILPINAYS